MKNQFTLVEFLTGLLLIGTVAGIFFPLTNIFSEKLRVYEARRSAKILQKAFSLYGKKHGHLPKNFVELNLPFSSQYSYSFGGGYINLDHHIVRYQPFHHPPRISMESHVAKKQNPHWYEDTPAYDLVFELNPDGSSGLAYCLGVEAVCIYFFQCRLSKEKDQAGVSRCYLDK